MEAFVCLFAAAGIVAVFMRNVEHRVAPYTAIVFVGLVPLVTLTTALTLDVPLYAGIGIGGHGWITVASVFAVTLALFLLTPAFLGRRMEDLKTGADPARPWDVP